MKNLVNKSFLILKNNIIFIQPVLIYFMLILLFLQNVIDKHFRFQAKLLMCISIFLLTMAFITGLFFIINKAIKDYNENDDTIAITNKSINNLKMFFTGIGQYFSKILSGTTLFIIVYSVLIFLIGKYISSNIGIPDFVSIFSQYNKMQSINEINQYILSFSAHDLFVINIWCLFFVIASAVFNHIIIINTSVLISGEKNILLSLVKTIKFFFKNIFQSIFMIVFMFALYCFISIISFLIGQNVFSLALSTILISMYFNYYIILVQYFYNEQKNNNSNNGT